MEYVPEGREKEKIFPLSPHVWEKKKEKRKKDIIPPTILT